jgi:hypothetical protein
MSARMPKVLGGTGSLGKTRFVSVPKSELNHLTIESADLQTTPQGCSTGSAPLLGFQKDHCTRWALLFAPEPAEGLLPKRTVVRSSKYLNNLVEQDHRGVKSRTMPMLGFKNFKSAAISIAGENCSAVSTKINSP